MFWQREVLRSGVGTDFNETYELDLPKSGLLGSLALYVRSTQNGQPFLTAVKWRLIDYISKIEVVGDGSTVIKSFDGRQALACAYHDDRVVPPGLWRHYSNTPHRQWIPLHFGRRFYDELHALDLARFNQVQLKVTNDATSTQFQTDINIDVIAYWLREAAAAPAGYYREEEWKTWVPAAAEPEYNDLPTSLPIRRILLRGRPAVDTADALNNSSMHRLMSDIEFTLRTGQTRVYKGSLEQLGHLSIGEMGAEPIVTGMIDRTAAYGFETGVGYVTSGLGAVGAEGAADIAYGYTMKTADVQDSAQEMRQREADNPLEFLVRGHGFMHNLPLFASRKDDDSDLLDPEKDKVVKVDITCQSGTTVTGTSSNAQNAIILSRLVR
ncbi:MAG: hypothetical protein M1531_09160 [Chloroflexi bacterium]|nr:hypothetical protein [Chloroflexota bacterium]